MSQSENIDDLKKELESLRSENEALKQRLEIDHITTTVFVPKQFEEIFSQAEENVRAYFSDSSKRAENGEIVISGERYVLIRSAALSYEFMDVFKEFYSNYPVEEALRIGNNFLFDIAHVLGKKDAKDFHKKMDLTDPIEKLSAGPVHFAFTGWANVEILPESNPVPNEDYFIKYIHHNSFEAQAWIKAGRKSSGPVCTMNCGYSSGWCEESFDVPLTAVEIACEAQGAPHCTFIMAPPDKIGDYLEKEDTVMNRDAYDIPIFFQRKYSEEKLRESLKQKETLLKEVHHRVKNNLQVISSLLNLQKNHLNEPRFIEEIDAAIARVNTMARVQEMIYGDKDVSSINIEKYISKLIRSLYQVYSTPGKDLEFDVQIEVKNVIFDPDLVVPIGLIINEIACNAMKHAIDSGGVFYLKLQEDAEGKYALTAGDNGSGIETTRSNDSLGMSLIEVLCEQIDASLKINNSSEGLEYLIEFTP